jgi:hypothetical protein
MTNQEIRVARSRSWVPCAFVAALVVSVSVANSGRVHGQCRAVMPGIEGSWLVTVAPAGGSPAPFPALVTYSAGGGLIVTDSSFSPAVGNLYQGTWTKTGGHEISFTFLGFQYDEDGGHVGYVRVTETVTLDPSGETYTGLATFQMLDRDFNILFSEPNTTQATRIKPQ